MTRRYLFPSISRDAEGGAPIRGKAHAEMTHSLKSHARRLDALFPFGGSNHKGLQRGGSLLHHGAGLLEEAQNGMEVHKNNESSVTRRGRKRVGESDLGGVVQADQQILVE